MKTRTLVLTIVLACAAVFVALVAAIGGLAYYAFKTADGAVSPKIDALFAAIDNGTFGQTYLSETTAEYREATTPENHERIAQAVKARLGRLKSKSLKRFNAQQFNAEATVDVSYAATFEKGEGAINARFKGIGGEWRLHAFQVDSPQFLADVTTKKCPACGDANPQAAKFCMHCGKAIAAAEKPEAAKKDGEAK